MINIIKAVAFAFSANIDNIVIGMSYGIKKIKISYKLNIIIATLMSLITCITMGIGKSIGNLFNINFANKIGAYSLIVIGSYLIISEFLKKDRKNNENDFSKITLKNVAMIIFTLSSNNIATGVAASMIDINIAFTFLFTFIFSFFMLYLGNRIGRNILNNKLKRYSNILSALIIMLLGIFQII